MSDKKQFIERLKSAHVFPGPYTLKIIGNNGPDFLATIEKALSHFVIHESSHRLSKTGKHISMSIKVIAPSPESVLDAYSILSELEIVQYVL